MFSQDSWSRFFQKGRQRKKQVYSPHYADEETETWGRTWTSIHS